MADAQPPPVTLDAAAPNDATLFGNLMELYIHDLSAVFPDVMLGPDGRFGYPKLPLYWSEPDRRFPFLIRCDRPRHRSEPRRPLVLGRRDA